MISMPKGLVQGLWRAMECPSMTIGGCLSSWRTFSSLMELWTRPWSPFQALRRCCACVFVCASVNVSMCVHFTLVRAWLLVALRNISVSLNHERSTITNSPSTHKHICITHFNLAEKKPPPPLFPVNNANKMTLICSTLTTFSDLWPVCVSPCTCVQWESLLFFQI